MVATIPEAVRAAAQEFGDRPAYVEGTTTLSFNDLLDRVERTATAYREAGLTRGGRVVLWAPNTTNWVIAALAVSWAGGVLVPANTRYKGTEVAHIIGRADAALVVVEDGFLGRHQVEELREAGVTNPVVTLADITSADLPAAGTFDWQPGPDDVADILFTSGTTGQPKGAMSAHRQSIGVAEAWGSLGGLTSDDRYLVINPFFHSFGYKAGILVGLLSGATLYPVSTFDVTATMQLIQDEQLTVLPGAPTIYQSILNAPDRHDFDLSSLRLAVTGAAVVPVVLIERMSAPEGLGIDQVVTAFGMTEAVVVTMCRKGDPSELVATTCGRSIPGMEIRQGDKDELLIRGDFVMLGYLDDPEATAAAIDADGWLHTGDVCVIDEGGNLTITDRLKDMYICGGFNVYPAEVEQSLMRMDGVADVAVIGVPDERMGEVGRAFVVTAGSATADLTAEAVIAHAREHLANFKVPRSVVFVEALPRNLSGKVLKKDLRA